MFSVNEYDLLKSNGTLNDRYKYVLSLTNKIQLEEFLQKSLEISYDDLLIFIFLSNLTKNQTNLLKIFQNDSLPLRQRIKAGRFWIKLQKDPKIVEDFLVETINNENFPRFLKYRILKHLNQFQFLKNSPKFFYELCCRLTEKFNHEQFHIDQNFVQFCNKEQIEDLLSRWSIKSLKQLDCSSSFAYKLAKHQPLIIIHLFQQDLSQMNPNDENYLNYFDDKTKLLQLISKKELIDFFIKYLNRLEKHQRYFPNIIFENQTYLFKKYPNEMIDLIRIVATKQIGSLKYRTQWGDHWNFSSFSFPSTFSQENFLRLFLIFYEEFHWKENHFNELLELMLQKPKCFFHEIVQQQIGFDSFIQNLLKQGNENTLSLLSQFPQLTNELSINLLKKKEKTNGFIKAEERLELIRYQIMTKDLFDQFLLLFKETGSNVHQRQLNYPLFLQSAISTNDHLLTQNILQFIEKRFLNEQLIVIEYFLKELTTFHRHFHLEILPKNFQSIETIFNIAINHLQRTTSTLSLIVNYGFYLLQLIENKSNQSIQTFSLQFIQKCLEKDENVNISSSTFAKSSPQTRQLIINSLFPKLISKYQFDSINHILSSFKNSRKISSEIDSFLQEFFTKTLLSSKKIQSAFQIEENSIIIQLFLQNHSTRIQRMDFLIKQIHQIFFINENIQRILVYSQQHRSFIDQLIQDDQIVTIDKLINEQNPSFLQINSNTKNFKFPGLSFNVLFNSIQFLTGKQQQHITNIIIDHFIPNDEITNLDKLKSLRILRRLTHTYEKTLQWINMKYETLVEKTVEKGRGAAAQPIDDIIICLPTTCDLYKHILLQQFHCLKTKINSTNAKFISDAMKNISRKISDQLFLSNYFQFIQHEHFIKLGITANKELLRLLIEYSSYPRIIKDFIQPIWINKPHQDIRACIISILLEFIDKSHSNDEQNILWKILQESTNDQYSFVIQILFGIHSDRILSKLKISFPNLFEKYVKEIQYLILDHPNSVEFRSIAWTNIDEQFVEINSFIPKIQQLCFQFDQHSNQLWKLAFTKLIHLFKQHQISSIDKLIEIIDKLMLMRDEIDSKQNGIDNQHDLPVYHRIHDILVNLNSHINRFDQQKIQQFSLLFQRIILFEKTFSSIVGKLFIRIAKSNEDFQNLFQFLQTNLPENYFRRLLTEFGKFIIQNDSSLFIQQLDFQGKIQFVQWAIQNNYTLFVWEFIQKNLFDQSTIDRQIAQNIIQQIRSTDDLFLREQTMKYIVPWNDENSY